MEKTRNYIFLSALIFTFFMLNFTAFSQSQRPIVQNIQAFPSSTNTINISWTLPTKTTEKTITKLYVYRDTRPIQSVTTLSNLKPIAELPFGSVSHTDTVTDFKDYFYAIISVTIPGDYSIDEELYYDEELDSPSKQGLETPYFVILPGVNATISGVAVKMNEKNTKRQLPQSEQISKQESENTGIRNQPLPYIDLLGENVPETKKISKETSEKALRLISTNTKNTSIPILEPYIFEEDMISPAGGDEWLLFEILRTTFIKNDYNKCLKSINNFLAQNRTEEVVTRAKFYEGQCYYFLGKFQAALNIFLELDETLPALSRQWCESSLDHFEIY